MDWLWFGIALVVLVSIAILGQRMGWIDLTNSGAKRRGGGGAPLGGIDEVFNPTRYETQLELDRQSVLPAPAPVPGDGAKDIYKGNVKIDVPRKD